jgi:hypothetical protein
MGLLIVISVVFVGLLAALVVVTRHFVSPDRLPVTAVWIEELSIERYRPMLRLLNREDLDFLRAQPDFTERMATEFRMQRCRAFQEYLQQMDDDFKRISMALKILMVQSKQDRADLASALVRRQITFAYGMMMVQFELVLYRYGVWTVDVADLMKLFNGMRLELRALVPAESRAGV